MFKNCIGVPRLAVCLALISPMPVLARQTPVPRWIDKTIIPEADAVYSVGHSQPRATEREAKEDALADATASFVRYCKVDVKTFDRIVETYSQRGGRKYETSSVESENLLRARAFISRSIPEWYVEKKDSFLRTKYIAHVLLKVPKEEYERILQDRNTLLSVDIQMFFEDSSGNMKPLEEGSILASGSGYAVYVRPSDDCYLYVYQIDATGKSWRMFPNTEFHTRANPISASAQTWLPNPRDLYALDETTGKERLYVFASPLPIRELEADGAATISQRDLDQVLTIKKMGIASIRPKHNPDSIVSTDHKMEVTQIKNKLQANGAFAYETWFWHK